MEPNGTIIFTTLGRPFYGFDIFSVNLSLPPTNERCLTDNISVNFNGQFTDDENTIVFISDRTGSPCIYISRNRLTKPKKLSSLDSLFFDRPVIKNNTLFFISAHEQPDKAFKSWSALYSTQLEDEKTERLTPPGCVDYSPAVSETGKFIAVASYGYRAWEGDFRDLLTDIVVLPTDNATKRVVVAEHGGWPTWRGDDRVYFHRKSGDGWWSIYKVDLTAGFEIEGVLVESIRVTPPGVHCFTPAVMPDSKGIAVATRRKGSKYRHIEIFYEEKGTFYGITEKINPDFHHYNPFISPGATCLGYHRFRGESSQGETVVPNFDRVNSPIPGLRMLRVAGTFPAFSPSGDFVVFNPDLDDKNGGLKIVKSDGSKRWTLIKGRSVFYNSWSPIENGVIFVSIGPVFESVKTTVQIARIEFDELNLKDDVEEVPVNVKILTKEESGNNAFPSVSPDGKFVVFRSGRTGHKNLYIVDVVSGEFDRGSIRQLTEGTCIDTMPSWSPDGKLIAFSSNRHNPNNVEKFSIYLIKPDGSGLRRIPVAGPEGSDEVDMERINHVCFSADCEWLLFTANISGVTAEPVSWPNQFQPYGELYVARLDGSGLRRLTWAGYENGTPAWHPTGGDLGMASLSLKEHDCEKLKGQFEEPLVDHL